ncbi:MAG: erythromycin esterase family protein [Agriterribacter sp.]
MPSTPKIILPLLLIYFSLCATAQPVPAVPDTFASSNPFISWAKGHALPLQHSDAEKGDADLNPIQKMIGTARVVALGEPAHGVHEPLAFRNRLFRFLVENARFTTLVVEAGLAESRLAADFVATGVGTAEAAAANLTIGKPSPENIALLEWMRQYNADPGHKRKVKFYGMDMQLKGFPGDTRPSHAALDEALSYLKRVDTSAANQVTTALSPYMSRLSVAGYASFSTAEHEKLTAIFDDIVALFERQRIAFIKNGALKDYEWAYRNAIVALQTDRMARLLPPDQPGKIPPDAWMSMNSRDAAMAENVMWILNTQAEQGRVLVYAHNAHVKNAPTTGGVWDAFAQPPNSTGQYLRSLLGKDFFIIGSSVEPQIATAQPGSLDKALATVGKPRFILDLSTASENPLVTNWLSVRRPMEANKVGYLMLPTSTAFDAVLFLGNAAGDK